MTGAELAPIVLRLVVGAIFFAQGVRKTLRPPDAPFGRAGLARLIAGLGLPWSGPLALVVAVAELVGGVLVLAGVLTVAASLVLSAILVAAILAKRGAGFLGGWDWPLACLGATLALALLGPGAYSLDALLMR